MNWQPISTAPKEWKPFEMFVVIGINVKEFSTSHPYTTDPYCVWRNRDESFAR